MATIVTAGMAVFFLLMGLVALAAPGALVSRFGLDVGSGAGRAEVRAVYGGFALAVAGLLGVAALGSGSARQGIVVSVAVILAGMAAGRLASPLLDRRRPRHPSWWWFVAEGAGAAVLLATV